MVRRIISIVGFIAICTAFAYSTRGWVFQKLSYALHSDQDEIIGAQLQQHVSALSDKIGWRTMNQYENLVAAAQYIIDNLKQSGYAVEVQVYAVKGKKIGNIIAEKKGTDRPENVTIVGANYDSYFNPGADTNASGIAALLKLADVFSKKEVKETVRFVAFVNKEPPFMRTDDMGSLRYARLLKKKKENIQGVIILDSIGYFTLKNYSQQYPPLLGMFSPDKGNFIALVWNIKSYQLAKEMTPALKEKASFPILSVFGYDFIDSDHWSFWKEGFPTVLLTDTGDHRNPYYHGMFDTSQRLDYKNIAQLVRGLEAAIERILGP